MTWCNRLVIVLNGEIYNYVELRSELAVTGVQFRTHTDTEVLLAAYERWGADCLPRLRGMFAFIIYDKAHQELFAARDRFGIKPLYFYQDQRGVAFASEIKQFYHVPGFTPRANIQRVFDFVTSGLFDQDDETMFRDVRQVPGGTSVRIAMGKWRPGDVVSVNRWYFLPPSNTLEMPLGEAAARYRHLLDDAVRVHLRADVTVGSCLSGGLDSSSIVALAAQRLDELRVKETFSTITAAYDGAAIDERRFAEAVTERAHIPNHKVFPQADRLLGLLDKLVWHQDEPFGSTSIFAQWCVFEEARARGIKVMLDGQGADEHLGGYHFYYATYYRQLARDLKLREMLRVFNLRRREGGVPTLSELKSVIGGLLPWRAVSALNRYLSGEAERLFVADALATINTGLTAAERATRRNGLPPPRRLGTMLSAQLLATNLPMLLHYEDRSSMAHGIEARVPFLDHPVVEFAIGLGDLHKIDGAETKVLLRRSMDRLLPSEVLQRRDKIGFATPESTWFRGNLLDALVGEIRILPTRLSGMFDSGRIRALAEDVAAGRREMSGLAWRLACLSIWARVCRVTA